MLYLVDKKDESRKIRIETVFLVKVPEKVLFHKKDESRKIRIETTLPKTTVPFFFSFIRKMNPGK